MSMIISHSCKKDLFGYCGPIQSIRDIGTIIPFKQVWDFPAGQVGGKMMSLQDVENSLISPPNQIEEDARLHSSIVCASISCPNIRRNAYTIANLDYELTDNFNNFISNSKKGMEIDQSSGKVKLSMIFNWFGSQFKPSVMDFIFDNLYPNSSDYSYLSTHKDSVNIEYFAYNWDVNALNSNVPCDSKERLCYPLWAFLVTIISIIVVTSIVLCTVFLVRRYRKKSSGYSTIQS
jgi:hypothetical protein